MWDLKDREFRTAIKNHLLYSISKSKLKEFWGLPFTNDVTRFSGPLTPILFLTQSHQFILTNLRIFSTKYSSTFLKRIQHQKVGWIALQSFVMRSPNLFRLFPIISISQKFFSIFFHTLEKIGIDKKVICYHNISN